MSKTVSAEEPESKKEPSKRKKYHGTGRCKTGWSQENLYKIVKAICKKCPGITAIDIDKNRIRWDYECSLRDLLPLPSWKRQKINPSERKKKQKDFDS